MKTTIKKIAAAAMAFTLLGTGTAVTKTIAPKADNTIVAFAKEKENKEYFLRIDTWGPKAYAKVICYPGINSQVAPSMKAKAKRTYYQGEIINLQTNKNGLVYIKDKQYDWVVTTSGYYVPVCYKYNYV